MAAPNEPSRTPDQRRRDERRRARQVGEMAEASESVWNTLLGRLSERRALTGGPGKGRVVVRGKGASQRLVVAGQVLVRTTSANQRDRAVDLLGASDKTSVTYDETFDREFPMLAGRFTRFTSSDGRGHAPARTAIETLRAQKFQADEVLVAALARPIIKSLHGPAPTEVTFTAPTEPGSGVPTVAVIDTGIAEPDHAEGFLQHVARHAKNIEDRDVYPGPGLDYGEGHGTFAAGVVQQSAPSARIVAYRALDSAGLGTELDIANAMLQATHDKADVLSLSLGCRRNGRCPAALLDALEQIDAWAKQGGTRPVIVAAAGNYGDTVKVWPAAAEGVVAVAALRTGGAKADWSSRGRWVDCSAVGEGVVSTFVQGNEDPTLSPSGEEDPDCYGEDPWAVWTGTSFAAPQVAGRVAETIVEAAQQVPDMTPQQALQRLLAGNTSTKPFGPPVKGYGTRLDILSGT